MTQEQVEQVLVPKYTQAVGFAVNLLSTMTKTFDDANDDEDLMADAGLLLHFADVLYCLCICVCGVWRVM